MTYTEADKALLGWMPEKVKLLKENILRGRPYVWELRLSLADFCTLEEAITDKHILSWR
jgi:hypothetical protein